MRARAREEPKQVYMYGNTEEYMLSPAIQTVVVGVGSVV